VRFSDNYENVSFRYGIVRNGIERKDLYILARGSPSIKMVGDAAVKTALNGQFVLGPGVDLLYDVIKPYFIINGEEYPLGEFLVSTLMEVHKGGTAYVEIEGYDRGLTLKRSTTENRPSLAANNKYTDVIQALLFDRGIDKVLCVSSDARLATTREDWEIGTPYIDIVNKLLKEINYNTLWFDSNGFARIEPYLMPSAENIKHTYKSGELSIIKPDCTIKRDTNSAYNVFIAQVSNPDLPEPLYAIAENNDPNSPISTMKIGRIPAPIFKLDNIASQSALQAFVDNERFKSLISSEEVNFETAKVPTHGVNDTLALNHDVMKGIYSEFEWGITLSTDGQMTHRAKKVLYSL
jgi:hypothetical protein